MKINFTIVFLLAATFSWKLFAQVTSNTHFTHLTTQDGLSNNWITCIVQDKTGYIWIGTQDGLNRYDGMHFKIYKHKPKNNNSLPNNIITGIAFDKTGLVWVGTNNGLCSIDLFTDSVTRYSRIPGQQNSLSNNFIFQPFVDHNNELWIGTDSGFNYFDRRTKSFKHYFISTPAELGSQNFSNRVVKILQDDQNNL